MPSPTTDAELAARRCWLFDMDGTLTVAMHDFDAMREALSLPPGTPILEALAAMEPDERGAKRAELDAMELEMAADAEPQPGAVELLEHLAAAGARLGIVTRNGRDIADATLDACDLSRFFPPPSIVSRDCTTAKPDPAGVQLAMARLGADAAETVMVGDYLFDLQAGHEAGALTVHMDTGGRFEWPSLTSLGVSSLPELLERHRRGASLSPHGDA